MWDALGLHFLLLPWPVTWCDYTAAGAGRLSEVSSESPPVPGILGCCGTGGSRIPGAVRVPGGHREEKDCGCPKRRAGNHPPGTQMDPRLCRGRAGGGGCSAGKSRERAEGARPRRPERCGARRGCGGGQPQSLPPSRSISTLPITTPSVTNPIIPKSPPPSPPPSPPSPRKGHVKARLRFWGAFSSSAQALTAKHFQMWSPPGPLRLGRT